MFFSSIFWRIINHVGNIIVFLTSLSQSHSKHTYIASPLQKQSEKQILRIQSQYSDKTPTRFTLLQQEKECLK